MVVTGAVPVRPNRRWETIMETSLTFATWFWLLMPMLGCVALALISAARDRVGARS